MKVGLEMYSVRDVTPTDMERALREASEMGYQTVEFAGFYGHEASEIKQWLDKYNLTCVATHTGADGLKKENIDYQIAYHKAIGCDTYVVPGTDLSTKESIDAFVALVNEVQPVLTKNGIKLAFHNHYTEFMPNKDGLYPHHELETRTNIGFEIDTYWAFYAGQDPVAMLERLQSRIPCIHLKDGNGLEGRALGEGNAPVAAVYAKATQLGLPIVVESESMQPDGLSEVKRCIEYLKTIE